MYYILGIMYYILGIMYYILGIMYYILGIMYYILGIISKVFVGDSADVELLGLQPSGQVGFQPTWFNDVIQPTEKKPFVYM